MNERRNTFVPGLPLACSLFLPLLLAVLTALLLSACGGGDPLPGPTAAVTAGMPAESSTTAAYSITVGGDKVVAYRCSIDGGAYGPETPATTPISGTLADGTHTLKIIGVDADGLWQSPAQATVVTWTIGVAGYSYARRVGKAWDFTTPGQVKDGQGIAVDAAGDSYLVDNSNCRILKYAADGSYLQSWGALGSGDSEFRWPRGIALDGSYLYVADTYNHRIVKYDYNGLYQSSWSTGALSTPNAIAYAGGILYVTLRGGQTVVGFDTTGGIVHSGPAITGSPETIAVDPSGNVFVGSDYGRVYKLPADLSAVTEFYNSNYVPVGLAGDGDGNLYVALQNLNTVEKVSPAGVKLASFGTGASTAPGSFSGPKGLAVAGSSLYVAETIRAQKLTLDGVSQLIYANLSDDDGALLYPQGLALDGAGHIYVADSGNHRLQKFANDGNFLAQWGGQGSGDGEFVAPYGVALDAADNLYVTDNRNDRVQKFSAGGTYLGQWGTGGGGAGELDGPTGISADGKGNLFVADSLNDRIQVFTAAGVFVRTWGSYGTAEDQMLEPDGIALDPDGNAYVVQIENHRVQKFSAAGDFLFSWAGTEGAANDQLDFPYGIARDFAGNLFVADRNNHRVQKFSGDGTYLATIGTGIRGSGDGEFNSPTGVAIDAAGTLYVVDQGNHRIQVFRPD